MEYWSVILSAIIGLFVTYVFFFKKNYFAKHGIPHPTPIPILGNMTGVAFRRHTFVDHLTNVYNVDKNAKYVGYYDFTFPVIMIRDLELMRNIAVRNFDHFTDHRSFSDPEREPLFGNNLFSIRGDKWRGIRNLLTPAFTSSKMKAMFKLMSDCSRKFSHSLRERCINESSEYNSKDIFTRYTNDTIATCAFGISVDSMKNPNNEFYIYGKKATDLTGIKGLKIFLARSFPKLSRILGSKIIDYKVEEFFYKLVRETIATRDGKGIVRPDMIQLMMETRGHKEGTKMTELSIESMTAQAFIFFFGGFDPSSSLMSFVAHHLAIYADIQKKLQNEIDQVMNSCNGEPTYGAVSDMEYLDAIINETLRLYPITPFLDRICTKDFELPPTLPGHKPVMLKPGDNIWFPISSIHYDPKYFPRPHEFDPARFFGDAKTDSSLKAYLPFGLGPRKCIGNRFALLETKLLFLHLSNNFDIKPGKKMILPLRLSRSSFNSIAEGGFWLNLTPRKKLQ